MLTRAVSVNDRQFRYFLTILNLAVMISGCGQIYSWQIKENVESFVVRDATKYGIPTRESCGIEQLIATRKLAHIHHASG